MIFPCWLQERTNASRLERFPQQVSERRQYIHALSLSPLSPSHILTYISLTQFLMLPQVPEAEHASPGDLLMYIAVFCMPFECGAVRAYKYFGIFVCVCVCECECVCVCVCVRVCVLPSLACR
jgi:hypothetical protein